MPNLLKTLLMIMVLTFMGCAHLPTGPNVMVLPGTGKSFEAFRQDDSLCEQYAKTQVQGSVDSDSDEELQERYDVAYVQCMYAKGQRVPVSGPFSDIESKAAAEAAAAHIPPPPPGTPPPPPDEVPNFK